MLPFHGCEAVAPLKHGSTVPPDEQVRRGVEALAIEHAHSSVGTVVTVSAGTATIVPGLAGEAEHLLREADIALYRAKRMGRNQVQSAPDVPDKG